MIVNEKNLGIRTATNQAIEVCNGEYIMRIDGHCDISESWDVILKALCDDETVIIPSQVAIDENYKAMHSDYVIRYLNVNRGFREVITTVYPWRDNKKVTWPMITALGCGTFMSSKLFERIGGHDEDMPPWGSDGGEICYKVLFDVGGNVIGTDAVRISHIFRCDEGKPAPYELPDNCGKEACKRLLDEYKDKLTEYTREKLPGFKYWTKEYEEAFDAHHKAKKEKEELRWSIEYEDAYNKCHGFDFHLSKSEYKLKVAKINEYFDGTIDKMLEIGCGPAGGVLTLVDANEKYALDMLADKYYEDERLSDIEWHKGTCMCVPFEDDYFDCIVAFEVYDHLFNQTEMFCSVMDAIRTLKPGGYFFIEHPIREKQYKGHPFRLDIESFRHKLLAFDHFDTILTKQIHNANTDIIELYMVIQKKYNPDDKSKGGFSAHRLSSSSSAHPCEIKK
jgi:SAM-dependent methyltransferase